MIHNRIWTHQHGSWDEAWWCHHIWPHSTGYWLRDTWHFLTLQISLCSDLQELLQAFFRDFKADGVEQPHKLFTGSWRLPTAAEYLGLSPQALDGSENSYVLVKLMRNKGTKMASGNIRLDNEAALSASQVQVGDSEAILKFVKNYGTHYFKSITVGDAIYQVSISN